MDDLPSAQYVVISSSIYEHSSAYFQLLTLVENKVFLELPVDVYYQHFVTVMLAQLLIASRI